MCDSTLVEGSWFELVVEVPSEHADTLASFLFDHGSAGLEQEETGRNVVLRAYFASEPPVEEIGRLCEDLGTPHEGPRLRKLAPTDWASAWRQEFHALPVGELLQICPTWEAQDAPGRTSVIIDPGMAFGTGHHATTRGCLTLLEAAVRDFPVRRALDVGTGSGILAIALAKLGVTEVAAIDNDPTAVAVARENAARNGVSEVICLGTTLGELCGPFDLVVANLYANLLVALAPPIRSLLRSPGVFICAGFLSEDAPRISEAYTRLGLVERQRLQEEDWVTLALQLQDGAR